MAVKGSRSGSRVMAVVEAVAEAQPVGVSDVARRLGADKSAVQRALMTLRDDGWIRLAPGASTRWELAPRILTLARPPHSVQDLRRRARYVLDRLRKDSGETVFLTVPDARQFIVVEALESSHLLRVTPPVGMAVPPRESATGRAVLAFLDAETQMAVLGAAPDQALREALAAARRSGFATSDGDIDPASVSLAAPIFAERGEPVGAVVVAGPRERIDADRQTAIGALIVAAAASLSTGTPRLEVPEDDRAVASTPLVAN